MYWVLLNERFDEDNDADLSGDANLELGGDISFEEGVSTADPSEYNIEFAINDDSQMGRMTDRLGIAEVYGFVFSPRLRNLLANLVVENTQYIDLVIANPKRSDVLKEYKVANIVRLVDKEESDPKYYSDGEVGPIRGPILDESRIPKEMEVFRLKDWTILPIVRERIKDAILNAGITGRASYGVEEYH